MIKINEDSNLEIEDFLVEEDLDCHKLDPNHPYDYLTISHCVSRIARVLLVLSSVKG
jgi:hypothetical protein